VKKKEKEQQLTKLANLEAEMCLLGTVINYPDAAYTISGVSSTAFWLPKNRAIFRAVQSSAHNAYSAPALIEHLRKAECWSDNGDESKATICYLTQLQEKGSTPAALPGLIRLLTNAYKQRQIAVAAHELIGTIGSHLVGEEDLGEAESAVLQLTTQLAKETNTEAAYAGELAEKVLEVKGKPAYIKTGLVPFDNFITGLWEKDVIILAGRPSSGKTAFALSLADRVSREHPVVFFSLEMSSEQLVQRLLSMESRVPLSRIRNGTWRERPQDNDAIHEAVIALQKRRLLLIDTPCNPVEMRAQLTKLHFELDPRLVCIDYLQLVPPEDKKLPREQQISSISRQCKLMAKAFSCPFLVLSQLNRTATNEKPQLHHLRESGAIEQDADMVLAINHGEITTDILVLKHRNGATGNIPIYWDPTTTSFGGKDG